VADRPAADIRLGNGVHLNGGLDAGIQSHALHGIHQGHGIHHGCQHSHIVCGGAVHAPVQTLLPAPEVAGADDDGDVNAQRMDFTHPFGDILSLLGIDAIPGRPGQRFAAEF